MGTTLSRSTLFPLELVSDMVNLVRGKSSLAALSGSAPVPFNGANIFTFDLDSEIDVVAENGAKSNGGATIDSVSIIPVKVEYGFRTSDEFMYAAEEYRLQVLRAFAEGWAKKLAKGLDIMAFHGFNPRTLTASAVIGTNNFDSLISNTVTYVDATPTPVADIQSAISTIESYEHEVTGLAISPKVRGDLAAEVQASGSNLPLFPEMAFGQTPEYLWGLRTDANATVSAGTSQKARAYIGNFRDFFKWGYAKEMPIEVIEYGDPDNAGSDLKGHNQVYLRGEAYIGWALLDPTAFVRILTA